MTQVNYGFFFVQVLFFVFLLLVLIHYCMELRSFSSRLSWSIIKVVSIIFVIVLLITAFVFYEVEHGVKGPSHTMFMYLNLVLVGIIGLVILFFVCRHIIRTASRANDRIESELNLARAIQLGILRKDFPSQLYAMVEPAREVGGDLYDFGIVDDTLYFSIGDVSGKGIPASMMMAHTRAYMRFVAEFRLQGSDAMARINKNCINEYNLFVTLFVASVNLKTGHMRFVNAGHNPLLIIPPDGEPYFLHEKPNLAIGLIEDFKYEAESVDLKLGTRIIAYTDGVTEAESIIKDENNSPIMFGNDRLLQWAKSIDNVTDEKSVVDSLYAEIKKFTEGAEQNDDITIMSIRV